MSLPRSTVAALAAAVLLAGCSTSGEAVRHGTGEVRGPTPSGSGSGATSPTAPSSATAPSRAEPTTTARTESPPARTEPSPGTAASTLGASDGRPRRALLTIPALGLHGLAVVPYRGWTDDAPGTTIQNDGRAASPFGPRGGVGPGGIGNYQVTAHRTSSTRAFEFLPDLRSGHRVVVDTGNVRYVYEVRRTQETSFRSPRSLAEQRAAVPGKPGAHPRRAFITLSTCATQEDHAAGNYWADRFDNPEHRIDKIGVLVRTVSLTT